MYMLIFATEETEREPKIRVSYYNAVFHGPLKRKKQKIPRKYHEHYPRLKKETRTETKGYACYRYGAWPYSIGWLCGWW